MDQYLTEMRNRDRYVFTRFKRHMFKPGSVAVVIGKKGSGKTTALADLAHSLRGCPEVTLFQKTYRTNPVFHDVVPPMFCYNNWDRKKVRQILKRQESRNAKRLKEGRPPVYHTIIVDDLACSPEFYKDPILEELFMNARWLKLNIIITLQDALKIHPALRNNTDWVFALKEINPNARKRLMEQYFGQFDDRKQFEQTFSQMTHNRGVMVLNNTSMSNDITDNYFHWRATVRDFHEDPKLKTWKMGSKSYWAFNNRHYDKHWNSSSEEEDDGMVVMR